MGRDYQKAREMDDGMPQQAAVQHAFQMFVHSVAGTVDDMDVGTVEATFRALDEYDALRERVADLEVENDRLREQLDALGDIGEQKTSKEQKIAAIVTYANQKRDQDNDVMRVMPGEIKGVVNVSRRYAYDLVDDMADEFDWARIREPRTEASAKDGGGRRRIKKALEIDFEGVHGDPVPVNKFTTKIAAQGVAD